MSHVQRGLTTALPMPDVIMQDTYGWNRNADMRVGKTARDHGSALPRADQSGDTKARRRMTARASSWDRLRWPNKARRPGSLKKAWPAGRGRHH